MVFLDFYFTLYRHGPGNRLPNVQIICVVEIESIEYKGQLHGV